VKKVEPLHAWGFTCVLIDLRNHGASGKHPLTFGLTEKNDVRAATDFAVSKSSAPVLLWGVSLGGASVTLDAADDPRVKGVITDSSYDTLPNTVRHHLKLFRNFRWYLNLVPQWPMSDIVLFWIGRRAHIDPKDVDVLAAAAKLNDRPTLFVANRGDVRIPFTIAEEMHRRAGAKSQLILTDSKSHGGAWRDAREPYEAAVKKLLDEVAPPLPDGAASKVEIETPKASQPDPERTTK
jgi:pimeloyl-ACP methyl ester carboxylesterase